MFRVFKQVDIRNRAYVVDPKGNKLFYGTLFQCKKFINYMMKEEGSENVRTNNGHAVTGREDGNKLE